MHESRIPRTSCTETFEFAFLMSQMGGDSLCIFLRRNTICRYFAPRLNYVQKDYNLGNNTHTRTGTHTHVCRKTQRRFDDNKLSLRLCSGLAIRTVGALPNVDFFLEPRGECKITLGNQLLHRLGKNSLHKKNFCD